MVAFSKTYYIRYYIFLNCLLFIQFQVQFIPEMVGPILEMTLIPENELRKRTIPIFFDMMQCEFMSQSAPHSKHIKRNFQKFENEMVLQLDALVESGQGDTSYKELFYKIIFELCDGHSTMREQGIRCVISLILRTRFCISLLGIEIFSYFCS